MSKYLEQNKSMHQGEKLRKYLKSKDYTQKNLLEMTVFSKSKLYGLYKQSELNEDDREQLIKDFRLDQSFFNDKTTLNAANDNSEYWQKKYYELLEKYNACLEDKELLIKEQKSKVELSDKHVSK